MNVINTQRNYYNNNIEKTNYSENSTDTTLDKLSMAYLDEKISNLENYIKVLENYVEPVNYNIPSTADFGTTSLKVSRIGKLVIIYGSLFRKTTGIGEYSIPLGVDLRPKTQVSQWSTMPLSGGNEKRIHFEILRENKGLVNSSVLNIYLYDDIPTERMIPINIVYTLDESALAEEEPEEESEEE